MLAGTWSFVGSRGLACQIGCLCLQPQDLGEEQALLEILAPDMASGMRAGRQTDFRTSGLGCHIELEVQSGNNSEVFL